MLYESLLLPVEPNLPFIYLDKGQVHTDVLTCMILVRDIDKLDNKPNKNTYHKIKQLLVTLDRLSYQHKYHIELISFAYESAMVDPLSSHEEIECEKIKLDKESRYWERIWNMVYNLCHFDRDKKISDVMLDLSAKLQNSRLDVAKIYEAKLMVIL